MAKNPANVFKVPALSKTTTSEIPKFAGSQMQTKYVFGHNPRKQAYTHEVGVRGVPSFGVRRKPIKGALDSATAPHKTDMEHFDSKFGFGNTGLTGES